MFKNISSLLYNSNNSEESKKTPDYPQKRHLQKEAKFFVGKIGQNKIIYRIFEQGKAAKFTLSAATKNTKNGTKNSFNTKKAEVLLAGYKHAINGRKTNNQSQQQSTTGLWVEHAKREDE